LYSTRNCNLDIKIIATEVLKGHLTKPGLLAVDGGRLKLTPELALWDKITPIVNDPGAVTLAAVDDFNHAINACVHAEKEYVRRVCTDSVRLDVNSCNDMLCGYLLSVFRESQLMVYPREHCLHCHLYLVIIFVVDFIVTSTIIIIIIKFSVPSVSTSIADLTVFRYTYPLYTLTYSSGPRQMRCPATSCAGDTT
jgi:hypothetical protein